MRLVSMARRAELGSAVQSSSTPSGCSRLLETHSTAPGSGDAAIRSLLRPAHVACSVQIASMPPKIPTELLHSKFSQARSEEHTSELQSPMRISYAVFCLKKKPIEKKP